MPSSDCPYVVLGIQPQALEVEITKAYRKLVLKHHPDKGGDTTTFQKIQQAYDTLKDPEKKLSYDATLRNRAAAAARASAARNVNTPFSAAGFSFSAAGFSFSFGPRPGFNFFPGGAPFPGQAYANTFPGFRPPPQPTSWHQANFSQPGYTSTSVPRPAATPQQNGHAYPSSDAAAQPQRPAPPRAQPKATPKTAAGKPKAEATKKRPPAKDKAPAKKKKKKEDSFIDDSSSDSDTEQDLETEAQAEAETNPEPKPKPQAAPQPRSSRPARYGFRRRATVNYAESSSSESESEEDEDSEENG